MYIYSVYQTQSARTNGLHLRRPKPTTDHRYDLETLNTMVAMAVCPSVARIPVGNLSTDGRVNISDSTQLPEAASLGKSYITTHMM